MAITLPTLDSSLKQEIITAIIAANCHSFVFNVIDEQQPCTVCAGLDPFCPQCSGNPNVRTYTRIAMSGLARAKASENKLYSPNGQFIDGDMLGVFSMDSLPSGYASFDALLADTENIELHSRTWIIDKWYSKGAPYNRIYVVLKEDDYSYGARK